MSIKIKHITQERYDSLLNKETETIYITDSGNIYKGEVCAFSNKNEEAKDISYDNTESELSSDNVQDAIDEIESKKIDKVEGKGLSSNDYTNAEKTKLSNTITNIKLNGKAGSVSGGVSSVVITDGDIQATGSSQFANLQEVCEAVDYTVEEIDKKIDKVEGKGLSSNDYTNAEKTKLSSIDKNRVTIPNGGEYSYEVNSAYTLPKIINCTRDAEIRIINCTVGDFVRVDALDGTATIKSLSGQTVATITEDSMYIFFNNNGVLTPTDIIMTPSNKKVITASNITVNNWTADSTYPDYPYKASISVSEVTSDYIGEIIFGVTEAVSGNYAPVCLTGASSVTIYSKVNNSITIPTIKAVLRI